MKYVYIYWTDMWHYGWDRTKEQASREVTNYRRLSRCYSIKQTLFEARFGYPGNATALDHPWRKDPSHPFLVVRRVQ